MDLNQNLQTKYGFNKVFGLVTNNGTGEHVFDQRQVFENVHNLCNLDGIMLHVLPFTRWLNHGFFNFNPIVFRDVAAANEYSWELAWIGNREGEYEAITMSDWVFKEKRPHELEALVDSNRWGKKHRDLFFVAAFRKLYALPFKVPLQGKYVKDVTDPDMKEQYS